MAESINMNSMKMNQDLLKLDRFDRSDFKFWQRKVMLLLTFLSLASTITKLCPKKVKGEYEPRSSVAIMDWDQDDYLCWNHILTVLMDNLFDLYSDIQQWRNCGMRSTSSTKKHTPEIRSIL